jgi:hypothetical protein
MPLYNKHCSINSNKFTFIYPQEAPDTLFDHPNTYNHVVVATYDPSNMTE